MTNNETYNGWANYPTYVCNLWLDNDEFLYNLKKDMAQDATSISALADVYKEFIYEFVPQVSGMIGDILVWAMEKIDFYEIAQSAWEDFRETEDNE